MEKNGLKDYLLNLPADSRLAFIELGERLDPIVAKIKDDNDVNIMKIVKLMEAFDKKYELSLEIVGRAEAESWRDQFAYIMNNAVYSLKLMIEEHQAEVDVNDILEDFKNSTSKSVEFGNAILTHGEKDEIHTKLNEIRKKIEKSSLPTNKKQALFTKIGRLSLEVDRYGTAADMFLGFALDVSLLTGKMHKNMKPIVQDIKDVLNILYGGRARTEGIELPKQEDLPQLPPPPED